MELSARLNNDSKSAYLRSIPQIRHNLVACLRIEYPIHINETHVMTGATAEGTRRTFQKRAAALGRYETRAN